jgi:hypothetical protein
MMMMIIGDFFNISEITVKDSGSSKGHEKSLSNSEENKFSILVKNNFWGNFENFFFAKIKKILLGSFNGEWKPLV